ncbi:MAG: tyrosine-protein phosphatase [Ferrimicrobium sp.]|nr:tyrosine-protein phosphatase [Ferrimicrobium sp.]
MINQARQPVDAHLSENHRKLVVTASLGSRLGLSCHGPIASIDLPEPSVGPTVELTTGETTYIIANRRIPLDGATNFRDAGGRVSLDGTFVPWRTHYRSENLAKLTTADWGVLEELGIDMVLDLRHGDESGLAPTHAPSSIEIVQIPIVGNLKGFTDATTALLEGKIDTIDDAAMRDMYLDLVHQHRGDLLEAFKLYRDHEQPIVVHCTAGKDRTGIVVALWQLAMNIPVRDVLDDYSLSSLYRTLPRFVTLRPALRTANVNPGNIHSYIATQRESLLAALGALDIPITC